MPGLDLALVLLELGAIVLAAKLAGELFERVLRQPAVLGEVLAGVAIGPHALGAARLPWIGAPLFPPPAAGAALPVAPEIWAIAQLASVVLLFVVGLETDLRMLARYGAAGLLVGVGGVAGSFALGAGITVGFGLAPSVLHPEALFLGAISVATSIGITARILAERRALESPEGTTILAAAVIDDVLGILVLAIVGALAASGGGAAVDWAALGRIGARAAGFWVAATGALLLFARPIARALGRLRGRGSAVAAALGLALLIGGLAEAAGLAAILGAYAVGLALSKEKIAAEIVAGLAGLSSVIVPIFFCVMGMTVDPRALGPALGFGAVYTLGAIVAKLVGAGLPALAVGFNLRGAWRVGVGMLPRGEVALIVAGAALGHVPPYIGRDVFDAAILMTIVTTVLAPPLLVRSLAGGGSGLRRAAAPGERAERRLRYVLEGGPAEALPLLRSAALAACERAGFAATIISREPVMFRLARGETAVDLREEAGRLVFDCASGGDAAVPDLLRAALESARAALATTRLTGPA